MFFSETLDHKQIGFIGPKQIGFIGPRRNDMRLRIGCVAFMLIPTLNPEFVLRSGLKKNVRVKHV